MTCVQVEAEFLGWFFFGHKRLTYTQVGTVCIVLHCKNFDEPETKLLFCLFLYYPHCKIAIPDIFKYACNNLRFCIFGYDKQDSNSNLHAEHLEGKRWCHSANKIWINGILAHRHSQTEIKVTLSWFFIDTCVSNGIILYLTNKDEQRDGHFTLYKNSLVSAISFDYYNLFMSLIKSSIKFETELNWISLW